MDDCSTVLAHIFKDERLLRYEQTEIGVRCVFIWIFADFGGIRGNL